MSDLTDTCEALYRITGPEPASVIKTLLSMRNLSQLELAKKHGLGASEVSKVISGKRKTRKIRYIIAQELGVPIEVLWKKFSF